MTDKTMHVTRRRIAAGLPVSIGRPIEGLLIEVVGAEATLELLDRIDAGEVESPIVLVHEAGGTTIGPLLGSIAGVVSTEGGVGSHIAILSKEFGCACVVAAQFDGRISLPAKVCLEPDGTVSLLEEEVSP